MTETTNAASESETAAAYAESSNIIDREAPTEAEPVGRKPLEWKKDGGAWMAENTIGVMCKDHDFDVDPEHPEFLAAWFVEPEDDGKFTIGTNGELQWQDDLPAGQFETLEAAQAWCEARDAELWAAAHPTEPEADSAIKGLSLWQPWASLIAWGVKKIETRSWGTDYRGKIAIMSTKTLQAQAREIVANDAVISQAIADKGVKLDDLPLGCILAVADMVDCIEIRDGERSLLPGSPEIHFGNYAPGRFMWKLENVVPLATPIPARGGQKIFNLPPEIVAQLIPPTPEEVKPAASLPEPKVGSPDIAPETNADHLREIEAAEHAVGEREEEWEQLKGETKAAKDALDAAVEKLRKVIRQPRSAGPLFEAAKLAMAPVSSDAAPDPIIEAKPEAPVRARLEWKMEDGAALNGDNAWAAPNTAGVLCPDRGGLALFWIEEIGKDSTGKDAFMAGPDEELMPEAFNKLEDFPTFPTLEEAKKFCQTRDDELYALVHPAGVAPDDESWKAVKLADLTDPMKIGPRALKALANHAPQPILTMGDLSAWQLKKGDFWAADIKGLGDAGRQQIDDATAGYWLANPREPAAPPVPQADQAVEPTAPTETAPAPTDAAESQPETPLATTVTGGMTIDEAVAEQAKFDAEYAARAKANEEKSAIDKIEDGKMKHRGRRRKEEVGT